jgi:hypothetical protein
LVIGRDVRIAVVLYAIWFALPVRAFDHAYTMEDGVELGPRMEGVLQRVGEQYRHRTGHEIHVTSGTRSPEAQAEAMYDKLARGQNILRLYRDEDATREIVQAFRSTRRRDRNASVRAMAGVIRAQMRRGVYISRHLVAGAADIRSRNMSRRERRIFEGLVRQEHDIELLPEGAPPHFHLQLR